MNTVYFMYELTICSPASGLDDIYVDYVQS